MTFSEVEFQKALALPRLKQPLPEFLPGNRAGGKVRVLDEAKLNGMARQWFEEFEEKLDFYEKHGFKVAWLLEWTKKYWWSWLMRDMSRNSELYVPDVRWKDPSSFGRVMVGIDEFVTYNFAFFDAIPDWRYDPIPGQIYLDVQPSGEVRFAVRYYGSGHWSGPLRFYPYNAKAPGLHGTGTFVQVTAVDRYHFNAEHKLVEGETVFDIIDGAQSAGLLPSDDSPLLHLLMGASKIPGLMKQLVPWM